VLCYEVMASRYESIGARYESNNLPNTRGEDCKKHRRIVADRLGISEKIGVD
jgi:lambda repressor-like predicted transcriptional regulator